MLDLPFAGEGCQRIKFGLDTRIHSRHLHRQFPEPLRECRIAARRAVGEALCNQSEFLVYSCRRLFRTPRNDPMAEPWMVGQSANSSSNSKARQQSDIDAERLVGARTRRVQVGFLEERGSSGDRAVRAVLARHGISRGTWLFGRWCRFEPDEPLQTDQGRKIYDSISSSFSPSAALYWLCQVKGVTLNRPAFKAASSEFGSGSYAWFIPSEISTALAPGSQV